MNPRLKSAPVPKFHFKSDKLFSATPRSSIYATPRRTLPSIKAGSPFTAAPITELTHQTLASVLATAAVDGLLQASDIGPTARPPTPVAGSALSLLAGMYSCLEGGVQVTQADAAGRVVRALASVPMSRVWALDVAGVDDDDTLESRLVHDMAQEGGTAPFPLLLDDLGDRLKSSNILRGDALLARLEKGLYDVNSGKSGRSDRPNHPDRSLAVISKVLRDLATSTAPASRHVARALEVIADNTDTVHARYITERQGMERLHQTEVEELKSEIQSLKSQFAAYKQTALKEKKANLLLIEEMNSLAAAQEQQLMSLHVVAKENDVIRRTAMFGSEMKEADSQAFELDMQRDRVRSLQDELLNLRQALGKKDETIQHRDRLVEGLSEDITELRRMLLQVYGVVAVGMAAPNPEEKDDEDTDSDSDSTDTFTEVESVVTKGVWCYVPTGGKDGQPLEEVVAALSEGRYDIRQPIPSDVPATPPTPAAAPLALSKSLLEQRYTWEVERLSLLEQLLKLRGQDGGRGQVAHRFDATAVDPTDHDVLRRQWLIEKALLQREIAVARDGQVGDGGFKKRVYPIVKHCVPTLVEVAPLPTPDRHNEKLWLHRLVHVLYAHASLRLTAHLTAGQYGLYAPLPSFTNLVWEFLVGKYDNEAPALVAADIAQACDHFRADDRWVELFAKFLDGERDISAVCFFLHALQTINQSTVGMSFPLAPETSQPKFLDVVRCSAVVRTIFPDISAGQYALFMQAVNSASSQVPDHEISFILQRESLGERRLLLAVFLEMCIQHHLQMTKTRTDVIEKAFSKADSEHTGVLLFEAFKHVASTTDPILQVPQLLPAFVDALATQHRAVHEGTADDGAGAGGVTLRSTLTVLHRLGSLIPDVRRAMVGFVALPDIPEQRGAAIIDNILAVARKHVYPAADRMCKELTQVMSVNRARETLQATSRSRPVVRTGAFANLPHLQRAIAEVASRDFNCSILGTRRQNAYLDDFPSLEAGLVAAVQALECELTARSSALRAMTIVQRLLTQMDRLTGVVQSVAGSMPIETLPGLVEGSVRGVTANLSATSQAMAALAPGEHRSQASRAAALSRSIMVVQGYIRSFLARIRATDNESTEAAAVLRKANKRKEAQQRRMQRQLTIDENVVG